MSKRNQTVNIEEEAIDKVEHFMAKNFKKILVSIAALLVLFIVGYSVNKMNESKTQMLISKTGQLEMLAEMSDADPAKVADFLKMSSELKEASDYINLRVAGMLVDKKKNQEAAAPLAAAGGDFAELADSLRYDTGAAVDAKSYIGKGKLGSLWYYRACLSAEGDEKTKLIAEFEKNYPDSELLKQLKRWNG